MNFIGIVAIFAGYAEKGALWLEKTLEPLSGKKTYLSALVGVLCGLLLIIGGHWLEAVPLIAGSLKMLLALAVGAAVASLRLAIDKATPKALDPAEFREAFKGVAPLRFQPEPMPAPIAPHAALQEVHEIGERLEALEMPTAAQLN